MKEYQMSKLMLGTVQFGLNYGVANTTGKPSFETVKSILSYAFDHGVTALDTSADYGDSEEVIGKALGELGIADRFLIVTKVPIIPDGVDVAKFIEDSLNRSRKNLRLDTIPAALLHRENDLKYLPEMEKMVERGLIGGAGVSLDTEAFADKADHVQYLQVPGNAVDHRFDRVFDIPRKHNFIRSVYLQGMLVMPKDKVMVPELRDARTKLETFGIPMPELCMRYLLTQPGNTSVLTGVERLEQLQENIRMAELGPLDPELFAAVKAAVKLDERYVRPSSWSEAVKKGYRK